MILLFACGQPHGTVPGDPDPGLDPTERATGDTGVTEPVEPPLAPPLELCINEISPANVAAWHDETGAAPDWIELHNPGAEPVDLLNWSLTDDREDPAKHRFVESLVVEPGAFVVFAADGLPDLGPTHLSFSLAEEGEEVALYRLADQSAEIVAYGGVVPDVAIARSADCGPIDDWTHVHGGTPGATNTP